MNNVVRLLSIIFLVVVSIGWVQAQDFSPTYTWKGEVRLRGEMDGRDFNNLTPFTLYTLSRIRLGFEAKPAEDVRVYIQAQDSRVFGTENDGATFSTLGDSKNLDLHQGYFEVNQLFLPELMIRLGRQELSYGNERLIGGVNFHNVGRAFDGALVRLTTESFIMDAFAMNIGEYHVYSATATPASVAYVRDDGQNFFGTYLTLKTIPQHRMDYYAFYQWNRRQTIADEADLLRLTLGTFQKGGWEKFEYDAEASYQMGKTMGTDISAFLLSGNVGYRAEMSLLAKIAVGCDYLSGTSVTDTKYKSFDPAFHTGHKFYGFMDYFIAPANTNYAGLVDVYARAGLKFSDELDGNLWIHQMSLAEEVSGETGLGQEIDATALYKHNQFVGFELGVSAFIPGTIMQQRFGHADVSWWGYLTTTVTF